jgi:hypothetical protein
MKDEIIKQVWKAKDEIGQECGHDLRKLAALLRKRQQQRRHETVNLTDQRPAHSPTKP